MFDRSFFWESETKQSSRARSLPVRTRLDSMTTLSQYAQPAQSQQRPAAEAPCRRYARRLAKAERARTHRRRSHSRQNAAAQLNLDFEQMFECPLGPDIAADISNAATDLQECLKRYNFPEPMCLTPMERFLVVDPVSEHWCIDSRSKPTTVPIREGSRASASGRVQRAIELAADVTRTRRLAALQGPTNTEEIQMEEGNERSWLDLDGDSQVSCSGGSRSPERGGECRSGRAKSAQAS